MSSWKSFHIKTKELQKVVPILKSLTGIKLVTEGKFPKDYYNSFLLDEIYPNYLIVGIVSANWVTVHYNSSHKLEGWCMAISGELQTEVILILAQNTSDYYYFAYYNDGQKLRELEYCYSTDFDEVNFGDRFSFENNDSGTVKNENYVFDFDRIFEYCQHFGLTLEDEAAETTWSILEGKARGQTLENYARNFQKPWWKFW